MQHTDVGSAMIINLHMDIISCRWLIALLNADMLLYSNFCIDYKLIISSFTVIHDWMRLADTTLHLMDTLSQSCILLILCDHHWLCLTYSWCLVLNVRYLHLCLASCWPCLKYSWCLVLNVHYLHLYLASCWPCLIMRMTM